MFGAVLCLALHGLSLVMASRAPLHCGAQASHLSGFSRCRAQAVGHAVVGVHRLSRSEACGLFPDWDHALVLCVGRQILIYCATGEVPAAQNF